ncbi:MAG: lysine--tRNA ligase [Sphingobacteriia bacterium]|nr:lysine--tRNA ligase [Sphingobacteriia bacterium]
MTNLQDYANKSNAWPFLEAKRIMERINNKTPSKGHVLFEMGYGPSGLPHLGTFGEACRTTFVRKAFELLYPGIPTKFYAFSDDMDGLRKVPDNIPNKEMVREHLGKPLTSIPDPFGTHESFGAHMNSRLKQFLDNFGFEYEYKSATECYKSGQFDEMLLNVLKHFDKIMEVMLPTLGEERQATYSPILPICPETGLVLQVPILERNIEKGTIKFKTTSGQEIEQSIFGGKAKLQWKADWAMRWCALDVDYEMHGKDLIPTAELSTKITNVLGYKEPILYKYELFLDEKGQKISKSKGNGLSMDDWLKYAPKESLALYLYQSPNKAKKLFFDVIPKQMDEYLIYLNKFEEASSEEKLNNPVWHVHGGKVPSPEKHNINFSLLLNLVGVCNPDDDSVLWGFISKYAPGLTPEKAPLLASMAKFAIKYYNDFIKPNKKYKAPNEEDKTLLNNFIESLNSLPENSSAEDIQNKLYDFCREQNIETKTFFIALYNLLLGQEQGPRWGSFIALYGIKNTIEKAKKALNGEM